MGKNKLEKLFELAKPYLEKNDFGFAHTQRVFNIARKYFNIPQEFEDLIFPCLILHDIGGSSIKDQYNRGPQIATAILNKLKYRKEIIQEVCKIIKTHHKHLSNPSIAFIILYDSDRLAMFAEEEFYYYDSKPNFNWKKIINSIYSNHINLIAKALLQVRRQK